MKNQALNIKTLLLFDCASEVQAEGNEPPMSFTVMKYGKAKYTKGGEPGEIDFGLSDAQAVVEEFKERQRPLVIDYEHQTLTGAEAPAAGWIKSLTATADGLVAEVEKWCERASEMMRRSEYRFFSPVIQQTRRRKILHSVALTNHPALHGIPALVADDLQGDAGEDGVDISNTNQDQTKGNIMKSLQKLAALLGAQVTDEMSEDQAVEAIAAGISGLCEKVKASEAAKAGMVSMTDYQTLKTQVSSMETENKKIQARRSVDEGLKSRKVAANMEPWALAFAERDPSGFSDYIKLAPEVIPAPPAGHVPPSVSAPVDTVALSDIQNHVANLLGIDAEKVYGKSKSKGV